MQEGASGLLTVICSLQQLPLRQRCQPVVFAYTPAGYDDVEMPWWTYGWRGMQLWFPSSLAEPPSPSTRVCSKLTLHEFGLLKEEEEEEEESVHSMFCTDCFNDVLRSTVVLKIQISLYISIAGLHGLWRFHRSGA